MKMISDSETGEKWGISREVVALLCENGYLIGSVQLGKQWLIPFNTERPDDCIIDAIGAPQLNKKALDTATNLRDKENDQRKKSFNGLCAREWTERSRSVWNDVSSARRKKHLDHGATFPIKLCNRLIEMYSRSGDIVLDPFLGTGTTVISAIENKRSAIGIELTDRFFQVAYTEVNNVRPQTDDAITGEEVNCFHQLIKGDCLEELKRIDNEIVQLTITSPPYADLIHKVVEDRTMRHKNSAFVNDNNATTKVYSDDKRDLGNMPLDEYLVRVQAIMQELFRVTKKGGYNIWVVKDYRDTRNGIPYIDLHSRIAMAGEAAGFKYHDLIIWDQNEQRRLVLLGYPSVFYVNQNHSYMVVLRK